MDVVFELLRSIPEDRLAPGSVIRDDKVPYNTCWQGRFKPDAWHVPVKVVSTYASMEDVKAYATAKRPDMNTSNWSYSRVGRGEVTVRWGDGEVLRISPAEMAGIEREHVDDYLATDEYGSWQLSCLKEEWPASFGYGPVRIDAAAIDALRDAESVRLAGMDEEELAEQMDCLDVQSMCGGRVLAAAMAAMALSEKTGTAAFMYTG